MKTTIIGRILLLLTFPMFLYSNVFFDVSNKNITIGDPVEFKIKASGENIKFPNVKEINNYKVINNISSKNIIIINGVKKSNITKSYIFYPDKNTTIPSFYVYINNKQYKTPVTKIIVSKPIISKDGDNIVLKTYFNKKEIYIGEKVIFTIKLKIKKTIHLNDLKINLTEDFFEKNGLKVIRQYNSKQYIKDDYINIEYSFLLEGNKIGNYNISSIPISISSNNDYKLIEDFMGSRYKLIYKKYYSNSLNIKIKNIPKNANSIGVFTISSNINKKEVKDNEPLTLTVKLNGTGNLYAFDKFKLNIKNATIYDKDPIINEEIKNDKVEINYIQKFSIINTKDYIIPSIKFTYYDIKTKSIKTIKTKEYKIKVLKNKKNLIDENKIEISNNYNQLSKTNLKLKNIILYLIFAIFLFVNIIIFYIKYKNKVKIKNNNDIIKLIKKSNDKELLNILITFNYKYNNEEINNYIKMLNDKIYKKNSLTNIKKENIIEIIKKLKNKKEDIYI